MVFIRDQKDNSDCHYQAHVWFSNHSFQCGCFDNKKAAEKWANWLQKRIVTADMIKQMYRSGH
ncbi:MAG: hypothetical protein AUJ57_08300 [Zetaproteobacteria bacterium CG1_02_53_45]|nr:MAG: hypothetical protein AUJ57_08300 [Zetaproteobacteria bacterium CG1_02_53_45]